MATSGFDRISRLFTSRRVSRVSAAHQATPTAEEGAKTPYLFVQSFESGSIAPKEGEDGTYTVTLNHGLGQTLYFADRPSRDVGAVPTERFLAGLGFQADNPPNAAIVVDDGNGGTDIAVVELTNPLIDPTVPAVIYDVKVLENWEDTTELGLQEGPADLSNLPENLGPTHLFIDDCADAYIICVLGTQGIANIPAAGNMGFCWNWGTACCLPCRAPVGGSWAAECNSTYGACNQQCTSQQSKGCWD